MLILLKMAFRNIRRNTHRTLLAIISVALAVAVVTFMQGLIQGMQRSVVHNSTKNESGHILLVTEEYWKNKSFVSVTDNIVEPSALINYLQEDPAVRREIALVTERIIFGLLLQHEGKNKFMQAYAGDVEQEKTMLMLDRSIVAGRYLQADEASNKEREIIVGKKAADLLKLNVGDTLKVLVTTSDYSLRIPTFKVVGIFQTGLNMLDDSVFQLSLRDAQQILKTKGGSQQILIMLKDYRKADRVARMIAKRLAQNEKYRNITAVSWRQAGGYAQNVDAAGKTYDLVFMVITLLGSLIITNIMMMIVFERRREIGIIKAMGFSRTEVLLLFLMEGTILGLIGSTSGVLLGLFASLYFVVYGLDFSAALSSINMPVDNVIKFVITVPGLMTTLFIGIMVAALVSIVPSWRAAKMKAIEAIKSV